MALADLEAVLVKLSCTSDCASSSLLTVNMETADAYGTGELALDVEHCQCPPGYQGTSCEVNDSNFLPYPLTSNHSLGFHLVYIKGGISGRLVG